MATCMRCSGTGSEDDAQCPLCLGSGAVDRESAEMFPVRESVKTKALALIRKLESVLEELDADSNN